MLLSVHAYDLPFSEQTIFMQDVPYSNGQENFMFIARLKDLLNWPKMGFKRNLQYIGNTVNMWEPTDEWTLGKLLQHTFNEW